MCESNIHVYSQSKIGIFWFVEEKGKSYLLTDMVPVNRGEQYGNSITWGGHYDFWEKIRKRRDKYLVSQVPRWSEYEEWPRGRVIFNTHDNSFVVYADKKILTDRGKKEISMTFCLNDCSTVFRTDGHYISIRKITI